ncbi:TIGR03364 family FAD-dependent oxidoreductase [Myroides sp. LJL119]
MKNNQYDLIVIGAGVLGTFHAYHAIKKGLKVAILEKDQQPCSATVRNFGQVVPSGMNTKWQKYGRESLEIYNQIQNQFDISVRNNGTVYLASDSQEQQLIEELHNINKANDYDSILLTKKQCLQTYPGLREDYVKAGLYFPQEVTIEPREMINKLHNYLITQTHLDIYYNTQGLFCENTNDQKVCIITNTGKKLLASKAIICCGSEFKTLYPEIFNSSDLEITKLQMLSTKPQPGNFQLKGSILSGLSIRRYEAFCECPSYKEIKSQELPNSLHKKWGVHILFKQATDGSIILGDSHQYADVQNLNDLSFDIKSEINDFMIDQAKKIFDLPSYEIARSWYGIYSQCKTRDIFEHTVGENIHIVTGIGGKGMTASAGFAKHNINQIFNKQ